MANRERGELTWEAGGRHFTLRLTTNSCAEVEEFTRGRTFDELTEGVNRGSFRDARLMLWVALRDRHPEIATTDPACLDTIGHLIDAAGGRVAVILRLRELVLLNTDDRPGGATRPPGAQRGRQIGGNSPLTH